MDRIAPELTSDFVHCKGPMKLLFPFSNCSCLKNDALDVRKNASHLSCTVSTQIVYNLVFLCDLFISDRLTHNGRDIRQG